jgi:putative radical SAM enzyme (TIGR03279 family)
MSHPTILEVEPGSPAAGAGLTPGDELVAVNGAVPVDVIEYQQLVDDPELDLELLRRGAPVRVAIDKRPGEPLGIRLNSSIFDRVQTCDNHCEFCFIYQLPPGMRQSLYLKDDDYRLSFLYGNFTTLTRFTELDLARVIEEKLGPLYVSIHATDPDVRADMLRNPRGATSLRWLRALLEHDIDVHGQIVLCPGVNAGAVLERTCAEIVARYGGLASLGVVPLGVSRYATGTSLRPHTPAEAASDLDIIESWQETAQRHVGRRLFQASDELYLMAGRPVPEAAVYEGFPQHENGIGMIRAFHDEVARLEAGAPEAGPQITGEWRTLESAPAAGYRAPTLIAAPARAAATGPGVIVTGVYGARALSPVLSRLEALAGRRLRILEIPNDFFGGNVAVAGLLVGRDIERALRADTEPAGVYVMADSALKGDLFLDDVPLAQVAAAASAPLLAVAPSAQALIEAVAV